jgi:probable F420-dependent oxidoreductase
MTHSFRFGLTLFPVMSRRAEWADAVKEAASNGFSVVTVSDHFGSSGGIWSALVAAHDAAPELRLGTLVLTNDFWNPSVLAREAISTDVLTDGKLELGLGAGWAVEDYRATGIERGRAGDRIDRLDESLTIISQALAGEPVRFVGSHFDVDGGGEGWPRPLQSKVPLLVGGGGKRILQLAARRADIVSIHRNLQRGIAESWEPEYGDRGGFPDAVSERVSWVKEAAGDRFDELELHALLLKVVVTEQREKTAEELGRPNGLTVEQVLASPHYLVGTVDQMVEDLLDRRERWGITYWTVVGGNELPPFARVVARLAEA